jgi:hypothetical protein
VIFIIGKAFQAAGIVCIPLALYHGIVRDDMVTELRVWVFGLLLFGVGWLFEKRFPRVGK